MRIVLERLTIKIRQNDPVDRSESLILSVYRLFAVMLWLRLRLRLFLCLCQSLCLCLRICLCPCLCLCLRLCYRRLDSMMRQILHDGLKHVRVKSL